MDDSVRRVAGSSPIEASDDDALEVDLLDLVVGRGEGRVFWTELPNRPDPPGDRRSTTRRSRGQRRRRRNALGAILLVGVVGGFALLVRRSSAPPVAMPSETTVEGASTIATDPAQRIDDSLGVGSDPRPPTPGDLAREFGLSDAWVDRCRQSRVFDASATAALVCEPLEGPARVEFFAVADANGRFVEMIGRAPSGRGGARCAAGHDEVRSWSRPDRPTEPAGSYACRHVDGRAEMVWSDVERGVIVRAQARDDDLATLFRWWSTEAPGSGGP